MNVGDILRGKGSSVVSIDPDQTVQDAVEMLVKHNIGSLLVVEDDCPVGIITERDILKECARNPKGLDGRSVASVMSRDLIVGRPDDEISDVMAVMTESRIRHLPILEDGDLAGMVSIGDVVKSQLRECSYRDRMAGRVDCAAYQDVGGRFPEIPREAFERSVRLIEPGGEAYGGAQAVLRSLAHASGRRWPLWLYGRSPRAAAVAERVYAFVACHRAALSGRRASPPVRPSTGGRRRRRLQRTARSGSASCSARSGSPGDGSVPR